MNHDLAVEYVDVHKLSEYHRNPRRGDVARIAESLDVNGQYKPIVVNRGTSTGRVDEVLAGNHTLAGARKNGWDTIACVFVDVTDDEAARIVVADNRTSDVAETDNDEVAELLDLIGNLEGTGFTQDELDELLDVDTDAITGGDEPDPYTRKLNAPQYEITGERPAVGELCDDTKVQELDAKIAEADVPDDVRTFLHAAAQRHARFNYAKIAEFYAHADAELQQLMEASALVIVDFDDAVKHGYVKLSEKLAGLLEADEADEGTAA